MVLIKTTISAAALVAAVAAAPSPAEPRSSTAAALRPPTEAFVAGHHGHHLHPRPVADERIHALFRPDQLPCHMAGVAACVQNVEKDLFACKDHDVNCQCEALIQLELSCYGICPQSQILEEVATSISQVCNKIAMGSDGVMSVSDKDDKMPDSYVAEEDKALLGFGASGQLELESSEDEDLGLGVDAEEESSPAEDAEESSSAEAAEENPSGPHDVSEDVDYGVPVSEEKEPASVEETVEESAEQPAEEPAAEPAEEPAEEAEPAMPATEAGAAAMSPAATPASEPAASVAVDEAPTTPLAVFVPMTTVLTDSDGPVTVEYPHLASATPAPVPRSVAADDAQAMTYPNATASFTNETMYDADEDVDADDSSDDSYVPKRNRTKTHDRPLFMNRTANGTLAYDNSTGNYSSNSTLPIFEGAGGSKYSSNNMVATTLFVGTVTFVALVFI